MSQNDKEENILKELITPEIQTELDEFMKGDIKTKSTQQAPKPSPLSTLKDKFAIGTFSFHRFDNRMMSQLCYLVDGHKLLRENEEARHIQTMTNIGFIGCFCTAFLIPQKITFKLLASLAVVVAKMTLLEHILTFKYFSKVATMDSLEDSAQDYRNVMQFYIRKYLDKNSLSPVERGLLQGTLTQIEQRTQNFMTYKSKENLLL